MTDQEIIIQLSKIIAEQKRKIDQLESMNDYLRKIDKERIEEIKKLTTKED
jgi:uncharacterized coiled-coil protein SlyX